MKMYWEFFNGDYKYKKIDNSLYGYSIYNYIETTKKGSNSSRSKTKKYYYINICQICGEEFISTKKKYKSCDNSLCRYTKERRKDHSERMSGDNHHLYGIGHTTETKQKISKATKGRKLSEETKKLLKEKALRGADHPFWKGGCEFANFDSYASKLIGYEVRRDPENEMFLQVQCEFCKKWYTPKYGKVKARVMAINHNFKNSRLYCSDDCKRACPLYRQKKYPKGFKITSDREIRVSIRKMVLERDNYECQICGAIINLHCHHIKSARLNPLEVADVDNCIILCKDCHLNVHNLPNCNYNDLKCKE